MSRSDDIRAAEVTLAPVIDAVRATFLEAGFDEVARTVVRVDVKAGDGGRHFAACRTDGELILLSPNLIHLAEATVAGIILHEFGHAADFLYPAQIGFDALKNPVFLDHSKRGGREDTRRWLADWEGRDDDEVERMADRIAEAASGLRIGYAGPCLLQTVGAGVRPRPRGLR